MITNRFRDKVIVFCYLLSYFFLAIGVVPMAMQTDPNLTGPMLLGNVAYAVILCAVFGVVVSIYAKKTINKQKKWTSLASVIIFLFSFFLVIITSSLLYELSKAYFGLNESNLIGYKRVLHMIFYRIFHDLISLFLALIFVFVITLPVRLYRKNKTAKTAE